MRLTYFKTSVECLRMEPWFFLRCLHQFVFNRLAKLPIQLLRRHFIDRREPEQVGHTGEGRSFLPMGHSVCVFKAKPGSDINLAQSGLFSIKAKHIGDLLFCSHGDDVK